jgi:predicted DNA-binding transcriptional regulator AlpA
MTSTTNLTEPLVTEHEAARMLKMSLTSLRRWRQDGSGPPFCKLGRSVRYQPQDIADFVAAARRTSTAGSTTQVR